jgi:hypothetical protein
MDDASVFNDSETQLVCRVCKEVFDDKLELLYHAKDLEHSQSKDSDGVLKHFFVEKVDKASGKVYGTPVASYMSLEKLKDHYKKNGEVINRIENF